MASSKSAPGSHTSQGVRGTMNPPFGKASGAREGSGGTYGHNTAPFDKGQSMGNGSIPTKFYDGMSAKAATTVSAGMKGTAGANVTQKVGTRRFKK